MSDYLKEELKRMNDQMPGHKRCDAAKLLVGGVEYETARADWKAPAIRFEESEAREEERGEYQFSAPVLEKMKAMVHERDNLVANMVWGRVADAMQKFGEHMDATIETALARGIDGQELFDAFWPPTMEPEGQCFVVRPRDPERLTELLGEDE